MSIKSVRALFLDFDGVINTYDVTRRDVDCVMVYDQSSTDLYNDAMARRVDKLCKKYNLSIVISSSWREYYTFDELEYILRYMRISAPLIGITPIEHYDHTYSERTLYDPNAQSHDRGMQISKWFEFNKDQYDVEGYVVLDDNLYAKYGHDDNFIHCNRDLGFDDATYEHALTICDKIFGDSNECS